MTRLLRKAMAFVPIPLLMAAANVAVDPAHLFRGAAYEAGIARLLQRGIPVANASDYDDRVLQRLYIEGLREAPEVIVLGSSRCLQIRSSVFPGRRLFNHGLAGASLEDDIALYGMYRRRGLRPGSVVLGVDPWLFNKRNFQDRWQSLAREYQQMARELQVSARPAPRLGVLWTMEKYGQLVSPNYLQASIRLWVQQRLYRAQARASRIDYYPAQRLDGDEAVKLADGSVIEARRKRELSVEAVRRDAIAYATQEPAYSLGSFQRLDPGLQALFEGLLDVMRRDGVEVILFLPPYHPVTYELLMQQPRYHIITTAEAYVRQVATSRGLMVIGGYDPRPQGLEEAQFLDGMHPKAAAIERLFAGVDQHVHQLPRQQKRFPMMDHRLRRSL